MLRNRYSTDGNSLRLRSASAGSGPQSVHAARSVDVTAGLHPTPVKASYGAPAQMFPAGGLAYNKMFTGIAPEAEESLIPYYRDIYYHDSVGGATVDIMSGFPFSDYSLVGLEAEHIAPYEETLSRLDLRTFMGSLVSTYLVDGAYIGSLVVDPERKVFQDILNHDRINCSVTLKPFVALDPIITANASGQLSQFLNTNSEYLDTVLSSYPRAFVEAFRQGAVVLDPVTTIYVGRAGQADLSTTSFLKRLLPFYFLEKVLYRGTLVEATKRQRSTTHVMAGTDNWEPSIPEMQGILSLFQSTEMDPLGSWIVTRNGVQVQDIRTAGDFWKVTDLIDQLVPHKLRALGMSEAFLAGDTSLSASEVAYSVFLENMAAFRSFLDHKIFRNKVFPLIAVLNGLYRDPSLAEQGSSTKALMRNLGNPKNLLIPELHWHKRLDNHDPTMMDTLEKLGEKGIPVPLKLWATAAGYNIDMLLGDLGRDQEIRDKIFDITGKRPDDSVNQGGDEEGGSDEFASVKAARSMPFRRVNDGLGDGRVGLANRTFATAGTVLKSSKSGKVMHSIVNERGAVQKQNALIAQAAANLSDPEYRNTVRKRVIARFGRMPNILGA